MKIETNHWAENIANQAIKIFGNSHVVCSGWSPSGVYHVGNSKEAVTCNAIHRFLLANNAESKFILIIDDYDPLDKIPKELENYKKELRPYLGHPLNTIPDFTGQTESYAEYFASAAKKALKSFNFDTEFVYASQLYAKGMYDKLLNVYFEKEEQVQELLERISGSRMDTFVSVVCEKCNNLKTTKVTKFEAPNKIHYTCTSHKQYRGCGHEGVTLIEDHKWKLKWRLDWPARQKFLGVTVEPSGKDHSAAGGSVDTALAIHSEIFGDDPPLLERFGFITLKGKKISGSKGGALPASKVADIMPVGAYLFLIYRSDLLKDISFNPQTMDFANLIDEFDVARRMANGIKYEGREREMNKLITAAQLALSEEELSIIPANVRFAELALIYQTSLRDKEKTVEKLDAMGKIPNEASKEDLMIRLRLMDSWLDELAPESMKFSLLETNPDNIRDFWPENIKNVWLKTLDSINEESTVEEFTTNLREFGAEQNLTPKDLYPPFYQMLVGSNRGPNAANLVFAIGIDTLKERISSI